MNIESTLMNLGFFYVLNEIWFILNMKKMMYHEIDNLDFDKIIELCGNLPTIFWILSGFNILYTLFILTTSFWYYPVFSLIWMMFTIQYRKIGSVGTVVGIMIWIVLLIHYNFFY